MFNKTDYNFIGKHGECVSKLTSVIDGSRNFSIFHVITSMFILTYSFFIINLKKRSFCDYTSFSNSSILTIGNVIFSSMHNLINFSLNFVNSFIILSG